MWPPWCSSKIVDLIRKNPLEQQQTGASCPSVRKAQYKSSTDFRSSVKDTRLRKFLILEYIKGFEGILTTSSEESVAFFLKKVRINIFFDSNPEFKIHLISVSGHRNVPANCNEDELAGLGIPSKSVGMPLTSYKLILRHNVIMRLIIYRIHLGIAKRKKFLKYSTV